MPNDPWFWSRRICDLATRGRFIEARQSWSRAMDSLSIGDESDGGIFFALHQGVARCLLHWSELDFAEEVLGSVPAELRERDNRFRALQNLLTALRFAEAGPVVFPLSVPVDDWWSESGHTGLPSQWKDQLRRYWRPARVEGVDGDSVFLISGAPPDPNAPTVLDYEELELSRAELAHYAQGFSVSEVTEGRFLELGYYGGSDAQLMRIGLHRQRELADPFLPALNPPPDRWYKKAVERAWESMGDPDQ